MNGLALLSLALCAQHGGVLGESHDLVSPFGLDHCERLANVGDRGRDGHDDLFVALGTSFRILSGRSQTTLFLSDTRLLYGEDSAPDRIVRLGDLNGDRIEELALRFQTEAHHHAIANANVINIRDCFRGRVYLVDGASFLPLDSLEGETEHSRLGEALSTFPDQDGDGYRELLVSAPDFPRGHFGQGQVFGISPVTQREFFRFARGADGSGFGETALIGGDIDQDGFPDLLVGEPNYGRTGTYGRIHAINPRNRHNLWTLESPNQSAEWLGRWMLPAPDLDGDLIPDFFAAGRRLPYRRGRCYAFSAADGTLLWQADNRFWAENFGPPVALVPDSDGDFIDEVLVTSELNGGGFEVLSGRTGKRLAELSSGPIPSKNARWDTDLDVDITRVGGAGSPGDVQFWSAEAYSARTTTPHLRVFGFFQGLRANRIEVSRTHGNTLRLDLEMPLQHAGQDYAILASLAGNRGRFYLGVGVPLDPDPVFFRSQDPGRPWFTGQWGTLDTVGQASAWITTPGPFAQIPGDRVYFAAVVLDASGLPVASSRAVTIRMVP